MACLKCGKETQEGQVFCHDCKSVMGQYPIKPGTPVHIIQRPTTPADKKPAKDAPKDTKESLKKKNRQLRRVNRLLFLLCFLLLGLSGGLAYLLFR